MEKLVRPSRARLRLLMTSTVLAGLAVMALSAEDRQVNNEAGGIQERPSLAPLSDVFLECRLSEISFLFEVYQIAT